LNYKNKKTTKRNRRYRIFNQELDYAQIKKLEETHLFNSKKMKGQPGLETEGRMVRIKPFGTLANRTVGGVYERGEIDGKRGNSGLELYYDSLLKGKEGTYIVERLDGKGKRTYKEPVIHGKDIVSTIDTDIQELAERVLLETLNEVQAESGTAIVMETSTGYIKAIANMGFEKGRWFEHRNYGISYMNEPGSTFKVVSMMIALDDGLVKPNTVVETGNGVWSHKGVSIKDHNAHRGGYGTIDAHKSIVVSSNIGIAKLIYQAYGDNPQKFMDGIMRTGAFGDLELEVPGYGIPRMRKVKGSGWSSYSLEKMSYGYENMIPPISLLTFFNGIANNGEVVKPLFVKEIMEDGKVIEKREKVVLNPQMCKPETLEALKQMLYDVVNDKKWGTGKPAGSPFLSVAGKTATAQILNPQGALIGHQVGFCGYFPAENPKYSCIVTVRRPKEYNPSGGRIAGGVFKKIAEGMYAKNLLDKVYIYPQDTIRSREPIVKKSFEIDELQANVIPDVKGMGGKDALFALEQLGLKVSLEGKGTVKQQSLSPGAKFRKGETIKLQLR